MARDQVKSSWCSVCVGHESRPRRGCEAPLKLHVAQLESSEQVAMTLVVLPVLFHSGNSMNLHCSKGLCPAFTSINNPVVADIEGESVLNPSTCNSEHTPLQLDITLQYCYR